LTFTTRVDAFIEELGISTHVSFRDRHVKPVGGAPFANKKVSEAPIPQAI
jgi:hypothetical protein